LAKDNAAGILNCIIPLAIFNSGARFLNVSLLTVVVRAGIFFSYPHHFLSSQ